jgi:hypothetical protein
MRVGTIWQFIGGGIATGVRNALFIGVFFVVAGVTPWQFVASLIQAPPSFLRSAFFGPAMVLLGFGIIGGSLWFNLWSQKQICIDDVSEQLAWAIHNLLNKPPNPNDVADLARWWDEVVSWETKVDRALERDEFRLRRIQRFRNSWRIPLV